MCSSGCARTAGRGRRRSSRRRTAGRSAKSHGGDRNADDREAGELISPGAKLAYPIREGVPIMLAEEARPLD
jgi:uncharacterized protein YbaR (Trm112 family)